jgi:hypothetical protein
MHPRRSSTKSSRGCGSSTACAGRGARRWHGRVDDGVSHGEGVADGVDHLVESPEIGIVGVGEGSTPQLKGFFETLDIAESTWMPRCNATYKTGISFVGWSERPGCASYFHPFPTGIDGMTAPIFFEALRGCRHGEDITTTPDRFFLSAWLAVHRRAPVASTNFPFDIGYGYHFDAHLIGAFLRGHATAVLGVHHLARRVVDVAMTEAGIDNLVTEGGEAVAADLFVDASGFRSLFTQGALGVEFVPFAANLFNDRAVVMPTSADATGTNSATTATALGSGWAWDIPLTNLTGNGYVYSSRYLDADGAETELRSHLGMLDSPTAARHLSMKVGRVATTWTSNVLAVGLAQGFIEPLEATALHLVQVTVEGFITAYEVGSRDIFNAKIANRFEGIRDYIVAHYRLSQRRDTGYWRDNASNQHLSDSLKGIMTAWFTGDDLKAEIDRQGIAAFYAPISWGCLLAGYGTFPDRSRLHAVDETATMARVDDFLARCGMNFADHKTLLDGWGF